METILRQGGPSKLVKARQELAKQVEKRKYDAVLYKHCGDARAKRRAQNRKSSKSTSEGRKAQTRTMEEISTVGAIQEHSLLVVNAHLEREISYAEKELARICMFRKQ